MSDRPNQLSRRPPTVLKRHFVALATLSVAVTTAVVISPATPALASSYSMTVVSPVAGRIGIDAVYAGGGGGGAYDVATCSNTGQPTLGWNANGQLEGTSSVPDTKFGPLTQVRFEMYPGGCGTYDGWGNVGGVHFETAPGSRNLGEIVMPVVGQRGAFKLEGDILSSSPITTGRVTVDSFQIASGYPSPPAPLQNNGAVEYGSFASTASRGARWSGGVGWQGLYLMFVNDVVTGTGITALVDISAGTIPTIDLDAICFGFDTCTYGKGGPTTTAGTFHATAPTRILDTRTALGISNGPVQSGDGREASPDPLTRIQTTANHDLQVTGRFGVPASGVSAVLLNVTAVSAGAPGPGYMSVVPKPARAGDVFNDQGSYGVFPATSNLNILDGNPTPNLVLARVGAGGKIRIANYLGPTHVIADIAGWFGTGGAYTDGANFSGVVPSRVLDSRVGINSAVAPFAPGESRTVQVAGVAGIPRDARSVVVNVTLTGSPGAGYVTAYPDGEALPNASNVNITPGGVRSNTSVVKIGANGRIRLTVAETSSDVIVDILGSFGTAGGRVTTITPERIVDSRAGLATDGRPLGQFETRTVGIAGRGSIPWNATAVIANVTAADTTAWGYLSVWPSGAAQPASSNVNFLPGQNVPNLVMIKLGTGGGLSLFNGPGSANVIIDVMGYVT
jgi:hypothetical protein